ncbi:hypothetical protein PUN28_019999 [Cardiocondyla obscurior]|uniref:Uncharacterized protein n=1 Tax=Cardiocondyla obscurior TaxID=286306 RepID=A0AAW2E8G6_9HYME
MPVLMLCFHCAKTVHQRELIFIKVLKVTGFKLYRQKVWRFGDERFATETNQGNRPKTRGSRRSLSDHSWCKRKILDLPSTPDSTNTLQSEFRFGALGTKGSRRKLTKETVRRPGKAAEVSLTIPGAREKSSTYPVLQIALTLCRVWRFGDERFATETNQGNRPKTRESRRSLSDHSWCKRKIFDLPSTPDSTNTLQSEFRFGALGTKGSRRKLTKPSGDPGSRRSLSDHSWCKRKILDLPSTPDSTNTLQSEFRFGALGTKGLRRKLTKETVRRPGKAAEVSLTIPGAREKSSTYPVLQIALTLCRVNSGMFGALGTKGSRRKLTKETVRRPGEAAEVSLTIPGAREKSSTYPVLQIALTLCRVNSGLALWGRKVRDETNQGNRPETRGSRRSPSDHSWCKRKIFDLPSTPDSTNTLQSEFRFGALGTKGSRRKLTKENVRRPGKAAEVSLTISGARENSSTYPVLQIALTLCRVNSGLALWGRKVWRFGDERFATETNQGNRPETQGSRRSLSDHSWCKRKFLDLPSTPDSTNTLQSEFRFGALGTKGSRRKLTKETVRRPGEAAEVSLTIPGAREKSSTYPVVFFRGVAGRFRRSASRFGALGTKGSRRKLTKETVRRPGKAAEVSLTIPGAREKSSTYPVLQIALTLCRVWRFGDERFATETNQGKRPKTWESRRSFSDHSWCKRKILDLPITPDSTNTLQSEFRFGALGTKGSRRKLTKETVRRPGEAAEVPLTILGAREKSSTYPVLQIALTLCRVWRFGDERFATETNQGNRPKTRESRRSFSDHSWCKRKILDLPSTPDSTNTLQSEFRFGALGTEGSRRKLTKETVRRPGEAAEVPLTIPGAREKSSTYPLLQIALTLCRVNSGNRPETRGSRRSPSDHSWCKRKIFDLPSTPDSTDTLQSEFRFAAFGTKGSRRKLTKETVRRPGEAAEVPLTIPGAREKSSTYPLLQIALTLCRVNSGLALWGRKDRDEN